MFNLKLLSALGGLGIGIYFLCAIFTALRTGMARYRRFTYRRSENPAQYWGFIAYCAIAGIMFSAAAALVMLHS